MGTGFRFKFTWQFYNKVSIQNNCKRIKRLSEQRWSLVNSGLSVIGGDHNSLKLMVIKKWLARVLTGVYSQKSLNEKRSPKGKQHGYN